VLKLPLYSGIYHTCGLSIHGFKIIGSYLLMGYHFFHTNWTCEGGQVQKLTVVRSIVKKIDHNSGSRVKIYFLKIKGNFKKKKHTCERQ